MPPRRSRVALAATLLAATAACALAACVAEEPVVPAEPELETVPTAALHWVAPIASGERVAVDEPLDLTVYTQHAEARVVRFLVDGVEADVCDPADPEADCHRDQQWSTATTFITPGTHTLTAAFTTASGDVITAPPLAIEVVTEDQLPDEPEGAIPDIDTPDPEVAAEADPEGTGQVVSAITGPLGARDPNRPAQHALCHRRNAGRCRDDAAPTACLRWSVRDGRVRLTRGRIDGSRTRVDRCMQEHYASVLRYADTDAVSRASLVAWLSASGNCEPRRAWRGNLLNRGRCAAAYRATHRGAPQLSGRECVRRVRQSADLGIQLASHFLKSQRRRHLRNPVLVAALVSGGMHTQQPRANHWCVGAGPRSEDFVDRFVAEYNAFREWERNLRIRGVGGVALTTPMRVGVHLDPEDYANCPPPAGTAPSPGCAVLIEQQFNRYSAQAGGVFWTTVHKKGADCRAGDPHVVTGANGECFDFTRMDASVDLARALNRPLDVNTLLYPSAPDWLTAEVASLGDAARRARLRAAASEYLTRMICRYSASAACNASPLCRDGSCAYIPAGTYHPVETWTLFNEVTDARGTPVLTPQGVELRLVGPVFRPFGDEFPAFMREMYLLAIGLAPDAVLMINENIAEGVGAPAGNYLALVRWLLSQNTPVHAVGLQAHMTANRQSSRYVEPAAFRANLAALSTAHLDQETQRPFRLHPSFDGTPGVRLRITELGVRRNENREGPDATSSAITSTVGEDVQARYLYDLMRACRETARCDSVTWWAVTDARSWDNCFRARILLPGNARVGEVDQANLFDARACPRRMLLPAFNAALASAPFPTAFPEVACERPAVACICCPRGGGVPTCAPAGTTLTCSRCGEAWYTTAPPAGEACSPVFTVP